jgi:hypothetical protein
MGRELVEGGFWVGIIYRIFGVDQNNQDSKSEKLADLILDAKVSVWSVVGNINGDLWKNDLVSHSLQKASADGVDIRIIVNRLDAPKNEIINHLWKNGHIAIDYLCDQNVSHFTVVDANSARIEPLHFRDGSPDRAILKPRTRMLGKRLSMDFVELQRIATPLSKVIAPNEYHPLKQQDPP